MSPTFALLISITAIGVAVWISYVLWNRQVKKVDVLMKANELSELEATVKKTIGEMKNV